MSHDWADYRTAQATHTYLTTINEVEEVDLNSPMMSQKEIYAPDYRTVSRRSSRRRLYIQLFVSLVFGFAVLHALLSWSSQPTDIAKSGFASEDKAVQTDDFPDTIKTHTTIPPETLWKTYVKTTEAVTTTTTAATPAATDVAPAEHTTESPQNTSSPILKPTVTTSTADLGRVEQGPW